MGFLAWAKRLDDRVVPATRRIRRRTALRLGWGLLGLGVLQYVVSFFDDSASTARGAATTVAIAGLVLGRAQEHDLAKKDLGLRPD